MSDSTLALCLLTQQEGLHFYCVSMSSDFTAGQIKAISAWQVCVLSLSFASFNSLYLNLEGVKERWREQTCEAADREQYRGGLSEREPPSSANLEFSLRLITNHHPDSARAKDEKSWTPLSHPHSYPLLPLSLLCRSPPLSSHATRGGKLAFKKANL